MLRTCAMDVSLYWSSYRYFPYEKRLAEREVEALLSPSEVTTSKIGMRVSGVTGDESQLKRLVYFGGYKLNGIIHPTLQNSLERTCSVTGAQRRQSTRYSVHGMHEYKGKFNPQVVRGVLNLLGISQDSEVLDPFVGSGTSLVECAHADMTAVGCDINPLAVYIANAKLKALATPVNELRESYSRLFGEIEAHDRTLALGGEQRARRSYLESWFDPPTLGLIEALRYSIVENAPEHSDVFLVLASDLLRDYSLQEPTDLRIRRRYTAFPEEPLLDAFKRKVLVFLDNLDSVQQVLGVKDACSGAFLCDSRALSNDTSFPKPAIGYDAAITSPPYSTALPYIDTQRLSLIWLGLVTPTSLAHLEASLTGSREFAQDQKRRWQESLTANRSHLPSHLFEYCLSLQKSIAKTDGFRRQSVPALIYRYLSDMRDVFREVLTVMKRSAPFALIVGHNRTTLGGRSFNIDTPALLCETAMTCGWRHEESLSLETYQRYGSHMANSVKAETLLIMRKP